MKVYIYRPNDEIEEREVTLPDTFPGYAWLKHFMRAYLGDGSYMEHVSVLFNGTRADMFVDEDGISKGLPFNKTATTLYRAAWMSSHPKDDPDSLPPIVGTAVLFGGPVWF